MHPREKRGLAAALFAATLVAPAFAADAPPAGALSCTNCHGPKGASPGPMPTIAHMEAAKMAARLREFRNGAEATVMNRIAKGYTDAEIDALAAYYSRLP